MSVNVVAIRRTEPLTYSVTLGMGDVEREFSFRIDPGEIPLVVPEQAFYEYLGSVAMNEGGQKICEALFRLHDAQGKDWPPLK